MAGGWIDVAPECLSEFLASLPPTIKITGTMSKHDDSSPVCRFSLEIIGSDAPWGQWTCVVAVTPTTKTVTFQPLTAASFVGQSSQNPIMADGQIVREADDGLEARIAAAVETSGLPEHLVRKSFEAA